MVSIHIKFTIIILSGNLWCCLDLLRGHPLNLIHPRDIPPPGYNLNTPAFHFLHKHADKMFLNLPKVKNSAKKSSSNLDKFERRALRRIPKAKEVLLGFDAELSKFLKGEEEERRRNQREQEGEILGISGEMNFSETHEVELDIIVLDFNNNAPSSNKLNCKFDDYFEKWILKMLAKYYSLKFQGKLIF